MNGSKKLLRLWIIICFKQENKSDGFLSYYSVPRLEVNKTMYWENSIRYSSYNILIVLQHLSID